MFTSTLDEEQQRDLDTVIASQGDVVHIVFRFDHGPWFDDGGGGIIDPNEAQDTGLRLTVENDIKNGFDEFKL